MRRHVPSKTRLQAFSNSKENSGTFCNESGVRFRFGGPQWHVGSERDEESFEFERREEGKEGRDVHQKKGRARRDFITKDFDGTSVWWLFEHESPQDKSACHELEKQPKDILSLPTTIEIKVQTNLLPRDSSCRRVQADDEGCFPSPLMLTDSTM